MHLGLAFAAIIALSQCSTSTEEGEPDRVAFEYVRLRIAELDESDQAKIRHITSQWHNSNVGLAYSAMDSLGQETRERLERIKALDLVIKDGIGCLLRCRNSRLCDFERFIRLLPRTIRLHNKGLLDREIKNSIYYLVGNFADTNPARPWEAEKLRESSIVLKRAVVALPRVKSMLDKMHLKAVGLNKVLFGRMIEASK